MKLFVLVATILITSASVSTSKELRSGQETCGFPEKFNEHIRLAGTGIHHSQFCLGLMYDRGMGISQSEERAVALFQLAAKGGIVYAQVGLGLHYEKSYDPNDWVLAYMWNYAAALNLGQGSRVFDALVDSLDELRERIPDKQRALAQERAKRYHRRK